MRSKALTALTGLVAAAVVLLSGVAQASVTTAPPLKNVGGRTPAEKVTLVAPGSIVKDGKVWAKTGPQNLDVTITGGAGVTPAFCHEDTDEKYFCYVYRAFGTLTSNFTTVSGRHGKVTTKYVWNFYDQAYPYAKLVPGNVKSFDPKTWVRNFFGSGARFALTNCTSTVTYTFR